MQGIKRGEVNNCELCGKTLPEGAREYHYVRTGNGNLASFMQCEDCNIPPHRIVALCGSTKFTSEFNRVNFELTLQGNIVLSLAQHALSDDELGITPQQKRRLDRMHCAKIEMSHEVFVINVDGYIGASTTREIAYARRLGKRIRYMKPPLDGLRENPEGISGDR